MKQKRGFWVALWIALLVVTGLLAFGSGPASMGFGPGQSWGRMGGWNADFRREGVFGGFAVGPGMVADRGWNRGMNGYGPRSSPQPSGLTPEQTRKIGQLEQTAAAQNDKLAQQGWVVQDQLNLLLMGEKRDWNAIRAASQQLFDLQRQQHALTLNLQQTTDGLLTDSQRQEMARSWRGNGWTGGE